MTNQVYAGGIFLLLFKVDVAVWTSCSPSLLKDASIGIMIVKWAAKTKLDSCRAKKRKIECLRLGDIIKPELRA